MIYRVNTLGKDQPAQLIFRDRQNRFIGEIDNPESKNFESTVHTETENFETTPNTETENFETIPNTETENFEPTGYPETEIFEPTPEAESENFERTPKVETVHGPDELPGVDTISDKEF